MTHILRVIAQELGPHGIDRLDASSDLLTTENGHNRLTLDQELRPKANLLDPLQDRSNPTANSTGAEVRH